MVYFKERADCFRRWQLIRCRRGACVSDREAEVFEELFQPSRGSRADHFGFGRPDVFISVKDHIGDRNGRAGAGNDAVPFVTVNTGKLNLTFQHVEDFVAGVRVDGRPSLRQYLNFDEEELIV